METVFNTLGPLLVQITIVVVMLSMGLQVTTAQILAAVRRRTLIFRALLANLVALPLVALALSRLAGMPPEIAAGFLLVAISPGASLSPKLAEVGRANVPFALGLMFIMAALSIVTTPVIAALVLPVHETIRFDPLLVMRTLVLFQLFPLLLGLAIHHRRRALARRLRRPFLLAGNVLFVAVVAFYLIRDFPALRTMPLPAVAAMVLMTAISLAAGWLIGGPDETTRRTLALATSVEFTGLALLVIAGSFPETAAGGAAVAFGLILIVVNSALAFFWRRLGSTTFPASDIPAFGRSRPGGDLDASR